ncbi:MAG: hypothetical protein U0821_25265 [Chloroflexota bacterium]
MCNNFPLALGNVTFGAAVVTSQVTGTGGASLWLAGIPVAVSGTLVNGGTSILTTLNAVNVVGYNSGPLGLSGNPVNVYGTLANGSPSYLTPLYTGKLNTSADPLEQSAQDTDFTSGQYALRFRRSAVTIGDISKPVGHPLTFASQAAAGTLAGFRFVGGPVTMAGDLTVLGNVTTGNVFGTGALWLQGKTQGGGTVNVAGTLVAGPVNATLMTAQGLTVGNVFGTGGTLWLQGPTAVNVTGDLTTGRIAAGGQVSTPNLVATDILATNVRANADVEAWAFYATKTPPPGNPPPPTRPTKIADQFGCYYA